MLPFGSVYFPAKALPQEDQADKGQLQAEVQAAEGAQKDHENHQGHRYLLVREDLKDHEDYEVYKVK